ncbi:MAG: GtrA family protein [Pseudomonadota bacterium]
MWHALIRSSSLPATGSRFIMVGLAATLTHLLTANVLITFETAPPNASVYGYLVGMIVSFSGHKYLTFQKKGATPLHVVRFLITSAIGLAISYLGMQVGQDVLGWGPRISSVAVCTVIPVINFFIMRLWVFNRG